MAYGVFLRAAAVSLNWILGFCLELLEITALLDSCKVSAKEGIHILEFCNFFVTKASGTDTDSKAKGAKSVLSYILMGVGIFKAAETVFSSTNVFII